MMYPAHRAFVAPARHRPALWRLAVGLVLSLGVYAVGIVAIFLGIAVVSGLEAAQTWMSEMIEGAGPTATLLLLASFIGMALGPMLAARLLHRRSAGSLFGPMPRTLRDFGIAVMISAAVYLASGLLPLPGAPLQPNLEMGIWLSFLPLAICGVLLQTGAEEVLFRGYLQQQLAARFASPMAWMVLPSVVFALLHYQPQIMGDNTWLMVAAVLLFALLAADLTAATGSIGAAWGMHFANNALAILVVSTDGPLSGLSLYTAPISPAAPEIRPLFLLDMATTLALWAVIRMAVTRKPRRNAAQH